MLATGRLVPWTSPRGTPLHIAAAAPQFGWSDLVSALMPNGRTLDYRVTSATADLSPAGVEKNSIDNGLFTVGALYGYYAPANLNPGRRRQVVREPQCRRAVHHLSEQVPAPADRAVPLSLLPSGRRLRNPPRGARAAVFHDGFTDDIFPVTEALRYYNLDRALHPADPIALFGYDGGHPRGENKLADGTLVVARLKAFFDHYIKGSRRQPTMGVTAITQTCLKTARSGGPCHAATWAGLHPAEVDYSSKRAQKVSSTAGNPTISKTFDPGLRWRRVRDCAGGQSGRRRRDLPAA